jgi:acyl-CoA synthetase (NDP forming)
VVQFYGKVTHLPETPELVVVAVPANTVPQVVEEVGQAGAKAVVVVLGGFAEVGRRDLEEELINVARKHGVRVLGPNCVGVYNAFNGLDAMFLPAEKVARPPQALWPFLAKAAAEEGVGVGTAVNFGNRADVTESGFLQYLDEVEEVKTVALYLEGFRWRGDAARFLASARRMKKSVVVYKAGQGADSMRAATMPPDDEITSTFSTFTGLYMARAIATSKSSIKSSTSTTPACLKSALYISQLPAIAAV